MALIQYRYEISTSATIHEATAGDFVVSFAAAFAEGESGLTIGLKAGGLPQALVSTANGVYAPHKVGLLKALDRVQVTTTGAVAIALLIESPSALEDIVITEAVFGGTALGLEKDELLQTSMEDLLLMEMNE